MAALRSLLCAAALAVLADASSAAAPDADEALRKVLRSASQNADAAALGTVAQMRPQLAYEVALEACTAGLERRASGADASAEFAAARRIVAAMWPTEQRKVLDIIVDVYASYDRVQASRWREARDALARGEQLQRAGRIDEASHDTRAAMEIAIEMEDLVLMGQIESTAGVLDRIKGLLDESEKFLRMAVSTFEKLHNVEGLGRAYGNLGLTQRQLGRYDEALESSKQSRFSAGLAGDADTVSREWSNAGLVYNRLGRYREALEHYSRALETNRESPEAAFRKAVILQNIGLVHQNLGDLRQAARQFNAALELFGESGAFAYPRALVRGNLGVVYAQLGDLDLARTHLESARKVFDGQHPGDAALANLNLASVELRRGRPEQALALYQDVERAASGNAQTRAQALLGEANAALALDRPTEALAWSREACATGGQAAPIRAECERAQGRAHRALGALADARASYDRALEALEAVQQALGDPTEIGGELLSGGARDVYREAIDVLLALDAEHPGRGHDRAAFLASERAKSRVFQDQVRRTGVRWGAQAEDAEFRTLLGAERRSLAQVVEFRQQARGGSADARAREAKARETLAATRQRLRERYPAYREIERPRSVRVEELQAALDANEAVVSYAVGEKRSAAFVIRKAAFAAVPLEIGEAALERSIGAMRRGLEPPAGERNVARLVASLRGFDPGVAAALYRGIFEKAAAQLAGVERVYVSADGIMFLLPLGALVEPSFDAERFRRARGAADGHRSALLSEYETVPFVGSRYQLRYLPAASVLVYLRERGKVAVKWDTPLVAFADPVFASEPGTLERLEASAEEARKVADLVKAPKADVYLRERASEPNVYAARLARARYLLFSTHGLLGGDYAGVSEPALALTQVGNPEGHDGFLTMSEVLGLDLSAEVTVLSACSTAGVPSRAGGYGEGFAGLARSFMYAGSRSVLVTHWSVFETVARDFVVEFFKTAPTRGPDMALGAAIESTRRVVLDADEQLKTKIALAHPTFWAGFALLGD